MASEDVPPNLGEEITDTEHEREEGAEEEEGQEGQQKAPRGSWEDLSSPRVISIGFAKAGESQKGWLQGYLRKEKFTPTPRKANMWSSPPTSTEALASH